MVGLDITLLILVVAVEVRQKLGAMRHQQLLETVVPE
jgi:hypothetical protein